MTLNTAISQDRFLRLPEVMRLTGLSRSSIYLHIADGHFPKQINLGRRCTAWLESEINNWITQRIASRSP
jgi:prophage regulatory protein